MKGNMPIQAIDRKLVGVLKLIMLDPTKNPRRDKVRSEFRDIRSRVVDAYLGGILDRLYEDHVSATIRPPAPSFEEASTILMELRSRTFTESAGILFEEWIDVMAGQNLRSVLTVAPKDSSLDAWSKAAGVSARELECLLLSDAAVAYASAGTEWILTHAKPDDAMALWEMILSKKERPKGLPNWSETAVSALKHDTRGSLLDQLLRHSWPDGAILKTLGDLVRLDRPLLKKVLEQLPSILCKKDAPETAVQLLEKLIGPLEATEGAEREFLTVSLARLGTGILLQDQRGAEGDAALELMARMVRRLRHPSEDETTKCRTWMLLNLGAPHEKPEGHLHITMEGARHISLAFEMASHGLPVRDVLTATARNLGLKPVGTKGEATSYDPLRHRDMDGGMLPGDHAVIDEPGWAMGNDLIDRAKVRKGAEHVRVHGMH